MGQDLNSQTLATSGIRKSYVDIDGGVVTCEEHTNDNKVLIVIEPHEGKEEEEEFKNEEIRNTPYQILKLANLVSEFVCKNMDLENIKSAK